MMKRAFYLPLVVCFLGGCVDLPIEERNPIDHRPDKIVSSHETVRMKKYKGIDYGIVQKAENRGDFHLKYLGEYEVTLVNLVEKTESGYNKLSIGFLPGIFWATETLGPEDDSRCWAACKDLFVNCVTAFTPTFLTLFYEPFDSYNDKRCGWWSGFASYGLIGCYKRKQGRPWEKRFHEKEEVRNIVPSYVLQDYEIEIAGNVYSCDPRQDVVSVSIPNGQDTIAVRIKRVPHYEGSFGAKVSSLKDLELPRVPVQRGVFGTSK